MEHTIFINAYNDIHLHFDRALCVVLIHSAFRFRWNKKALFSTCHSSVFVLYKTSERSLLPLCSYIHLISKMKNHSFPRTFEESKKVSHHFNPLNSFFVHMYVLILLYSSRLLERFNVQEKKGNSCSEIPRNSPGKSFLGKQYGNPFLK